MIAAAGVYLRTQSPNPALSADRVGFEFPEIAAYNALRLLNKFDQQEFDSLPNDVWTRWASVIVAYPLLQMSRMQHSERMYCKSLHCVSRSRE